MRKNVTLEQAKEILENEKVFLCGNDKFNVVDTGKYKSGMTIVIPRNWALDKKGQPCSPITYQEIKTLTSNMNIDFDASGVDVLFGKFRMSKNGRPVFELTLPLNAEHLLVRADWGGAFDSSRGQYEYYALTQVGATYFRKARSNGGGTGYDYWVLPVDFVAGSEPRDKKEIEGILRSIQEKMKESEAEAEMEILRAEAERKASVEARERVLPVAVNLAEQIKTETERNGFYYKAKEDTFVYYENGWERSLFYGDKLIGKLTEMLEYEKAVNAAAKEYRPQFLQVCRDYGCDMSLVNATGDLNNFISRLPGTLVYYRYSAEGFTQFIEDLATYAEKQRRKLSEAREKAAMLKAHAELAAKKAKAKTVGYPENFERWHRTGGVINISRAIVIEPDGDIRIPDWNNLSNPNHKCKYENWLEVADGDQGYDQILPGELIVMFKKSERSTPYVFTVEWADQPATEEQVLTVMETLGAIFTDSDGFAVDRDWKKITDVKTWLEKAVATKMAECLSQLNA